jgi:phosphate transport system substrate-binding protein
MTWLQRRVGILILFALLCSTGIANAQDTTSITVVGSGIVAPGFEALAAASGTSTPLAVSVAGTANGFQTFCQGSADVALANRTINDAEDSACTAANVQYSEQLIAHQVIAFIAKSDAAFQTCLTTDNLNTIFPPSAQGQITNWNQIDPANVDIPLSVIIPENTGITFTALDNLIQGDGIRADAATQAGDEAVISAVASGAGAIGVINYQSAVAAGDQIKILQLNTNNVFGCVSPSATSVEDRTYAAAESYYAYVNRASLSKAGLREIFQFVSSDQAATTLTESGLTSPSATIYAANLSSLEGTGEAAPFSSDTTAFQIPLDVSGNVAIAGAAVGREYLSGMGSSFQSVYTSVTVEVKTTGQPAGIRRLCNGEIDIAIIDSELSEEQNQNCAANNISTLRIDLGKEAVVVVGNANSAYEACLSREQLATVWRTPVDPNEKITNWNQLSGDFPDQSITLFQPNLGNAAADLLLTEASGNVLAARDDTEFSNDPLYRAAAVANVEGALTYMTWAEYQTVLANNQERIQLVGVLGESSCVVPTEQTIADGSYPLVRPATLLVSRVSLVKPQVQSFLWFLAADENYSQIAESGLIGVAFGSLITLRETLEKAYVDASVAAAEVTPEPLAEATADATSEATSEPSVESTVEATSEATPAS